MCIRDRHKRDAKNGWYRYDSRFALPVYDDKGELERYNVFHASMPVSYTHLKRNNVSERTIYRYKAYYDKLREKEE